MDYHKDHEAFWKNPAARCPKNVVPANPKPSEPPVHVDTSCGRWSPAERHPSKIERNSIPVPFFWQNWEYCVLFAEISLTKKDFCWSSGFNDEMEELNNCELWTKKKNMTFSGVTGGLAKKNKGWGQPTNGLPIARRKNVLLGNPTGRSGR